MHKNIWQTGYVVVKYLVLTIVYAGMWMYWSTDMQWHQFLWGLGGSCSHPPLFGRVNKKSDIFIRVYSEITVDHAEKSCWFSICPATFFWKLTPLLDMHLQSNILVCYYIMDVNNNYMPEKCFFRNKKNFKLCSESLYLIL